MSKKKEDSKKILWVRSTRKSYILLYLMILVIVSLFIYIKITGKPLDRNAFKLSVAFIIAILIATEIHRLGNSYEINNNSVVHRRGYFTIISKRIEFGAISDIDVRQNLWQRLLSYGDVQIFKFSEKSIIKNINRPFEFTGHLGRVIRGVRGRIR